MNEHLNLLGLKARDRVTGFTGIVSSVSFDLYGCIQAVLTPEIDKDGKPREGHWYDVNRLELLSKKPVMALPAFMPTPQTHLKGTAEKPAKN